MIIIITIIIIMIIIITIVVVEGGGEDMYRGGFICEETSDVRSLFCCACT